MENDVNVNEQHHAQSEAVTGATYTVSYTADEQQVLLMALGELLHSVRRDEHLVPTIESLIERVRNSQAVGVGGGTVGN
jgi:hypothetical protein